MDHLGISEDNRVGFLDDLDWSLLDLGDGELGYNRDIFLDRFEDLDVAPNLVAEALVVSSAHSEVGSVPSGLLRSNEVKLPDMLITRLNNVVEFSGSCSHLVTVGLDEEGVHGPGVLTIVSESPELGDLLPWFNEMLIANAFLDEATRVVNPLLLSSFGSGLQLLILGFLSGLGGSDSFKLLSLRNFVVLAD